MHRGEGLVNPLALDRSIKPENIYVERLVKLIPVEVTGLYMFLVAMGSDGFEGFLGFLLLILILVMLFFYLPRIQNVDSWSQRIVITISFVIWAANTNIELFEYYALSLGAPPSVSQFFSERPAGMVLALWTFVIPIFYRAPPPSETSTAATNVQATL
jgi:hypothetical protein